MDEHGEDDDLAFEEAKEALEHCIETEALRYAGISLQRSSLTIVFFQGKLLKRRP